MEVRCGSSPDFRMAVGRHDRPYFCESRRNLATPPEHHRSTLQLNLRASRTYGGASNTVGVSREIEREIKVRVEGQLGVQFEPTDSRRKHWLVFGIAYLRKTRWRRTSNGGTATVGT
jgi:hypothetical protein